VCSVKAMIHDCRPDPAGAYFYVLLFKHEEGLFGDLEPFFFFFLLLFFLFFKANKLISCRSLVLLWSEHGKHCFCM